MTMNIRAGGTGVTGAEREQPRCECGKWLAQKPYEPPFGKSAWYRCGHCGRSDPSPSAAPKNTPGMEDGRTVVFVDGEEDVEIHAVNLEERTVEVRVYGEDVTLTLEALEPS